MPERKWLWQQVIWEAVDSSCSNVPPAPPQPLLQLQKPPAVSPVALTPMARIVSSGREAFHEPWAGQGLCQGRCLPLRTSHLVQQVLKTVLKVPLSSKCCEQSKGLRPLKTIKGKAMVLSTQNRHLALTLRNQEQSLQWSDATEEGSSGKPRPRRADPGDQVQGQGGGGWYPQETARSGVSSPRPNFPHFLLLRQVKSEGDPGESCHLPRSCILWSCWLQLCILLSIRPGNKVRRLEGGRRARQRGRTLARVTPNILISPLSAAGSHPTFHESTRYGTNQTTRVLPSQVTSKTLSRQLRRDFVKGMETCIWCLSTNLTCGP